MLVVKGAFCILIPASSAWVIYWYFGNVLDTSMPKFVYIKEPTASKFGADFQTYLADATDKGHDLWWKWSFDNRYLPLKTDDDLSDEFKDLDNHTKLKEKCKDTYGKSTDNDLTSTTAGDKKIKYGRDAWRFCSVFTEKPKTIEDNKEDTDKDNLDDDGEYKDKLGETKKKELVSVTDEGKDNQLFWKIRAAEFFGARDKEGIGKYENKDTKTDDKKTIFEKLYDTKNKNKRGSLKEKCGEVYKLNLNGTATPPNPTQQDAIKYCGLKKQSN